MDNNYRNNKINKLKNENKNEDNINKICNYNFTSFNNQKKYNNYESDLLMNNEKIQDNKNYNFRGDENTNSRFTSYTFMNINSNPTPINFSENETKMNEIKKDNNKERNYNEFIRPTSIMPINYNNTNNDNMLNPMYDRIPTIDTLNRNNKK